MAASWETDAALREALFGNGAETRQRVASALGPCDGPECAIRSGTGFRRGCRRRGRALTEDLGKRFPNDTLVQFNDLPTLRAGCA